MAQGAPRHSSAQLLCFRPPTGGSRPLSPSPPLAVPAAPEGELALASGIPPRSDKPHRVPLLPVPTQSPWHGRAGGVSAGPEPPHPPWRAQQLGSGMGSPRPPEPSPPARPRPPAPGSAGANQTERRRLQSTRAGTAVPQRDLGVPMGILETLATNFKLVWGPPCGQPPDAGWAPVGDRPPGGEAGCCSLRSCCPHRPMPLPAQPPGGQAPDPLPPPSRAVPKQPLADHAQPRGDGDGGGQQGGSGSLWLPWAGEGAAACSQQRGGARREWRGGRMVLGLPSGREPCPPPPCQACRRHRGRPLPAARKVIPGQRSAGERQRQGTAPILSKNPAERGGNAHPWGGTYPKIHHHGGSGVLSSSVGSAGGRWAAPRRRLLLGGLSPPSGARCPALAPRAGVAGCPALASLPGAAWLLAVGHRTLQSRLPASNMLLLGGLEGRGWTRGQPRGARQGRGLFTPGKKTGEGGIKMKSPLASSGAKGRAWGGGSDPAGAAGQGSGGRAGCWEVGGSGSVCARGAAWAPAPTLGGADVLPQHFPSCPVNTGTGRPGG